MHYHEGFQDYADQFVIYSLIYGFEFAGYEGSALCLSLIIVILCTLI